MTKKTRTPSQNHQAAATTWCTISRCFGKFCLHSFLQLVCQIFCLKSTSLKIYHVFKFKFQEIWGGWACFCVSIFIIGVLTALIGDLASFFGYTVGLKDSVTAISFVALGTSLPGNFLMSQTNLFDWISNHLLLFIHNADTFASKVAAQNDKYADGSVGNVTGSNAVNVFLGIGIAWTVAAIYHFANGTRFEVEPGNLGFSVTIFCIFALFAIALMMFRRFTFIGGELGGPMTARYVTSFIFFGLWVSYLILSTLETYGVIHGF